MATTHAEFGLPIFVADDGELPQRGAFFATNNKWNLSKIAKSAYNDSSAWRIINMNGWNVSNLTYRADSTDCGSKKRESSWALTTVSPNMTSKSAFIALCQRDANVIPTLPPRSFRFPVIWIPDLEKMPLPVPKRSEEPPTQPVGPSVVVNPGRADIEMPPTGPVSPGKPAGGGSSGGGVVAPGAPAPFEAGMGPFALVGAGLLMLLGLLVWPASGGKKGRKKGKR